GSRASPTRQQTLAATLQWSHDLLEADERTLFRRLAVFAGGFGLEAVEEVCVSRDLDAAGIADVLARLLEQSLGTADGGSALERAPEDALRLCVALLPFWLRRIDLREAERRFDEALAAAPERRALRAEALLAAAAIDFRSGALPRGVAHAEESRAVASEIGDAGAEWRALQFLGELALASDQCDIAMPWLERALELARRDG